MARPVLSLGRGTDKEQAPSDNGREAAPAMSGVIEPE
jgi:hypothetical protein